MEAPFWSRGGRPWATPAESTYHGTVSAHGSAAPARSLAAQGRGNWCAAAYGASPDGFSAVGIASPAVAPLGAEHPRKSRGMPLQRMTVARFFL